MRFLVRLEPEADTFVLPELAVVRDLFLRPQTLEQRQAFVERLAALGREFDLELPKGASSKVDAAGAEFLKKHGMNKLGKVAKLHFRTTQKIHAEPGQAE